MPRGIYKRKKKVNRPKGRKNIIKPLEVLKEALRMHHDVNNKWQAVDPTAPTEPPSYLSRLEAATVKYEQAINEAINALKGQ